MRFWLLGFVLLGFTLTAFSAHACRIEHTNANTVTIRGECGEKVLMAQLSIAIRQLEARGEAGRANQGEQSDAPAPPRKLNLVNGSVSGKGATFFHRPSGKH